MNKKCHVVATTILVIIMTLLSALPGSVAPTASATETLAHDRLTVGPTAAFDAEPPIVVEHSPADGEELPADAPIELNFSQDMDRAVVEAAFAISPDVPLQFTWTSDRAVAVRPAAGQFERGQVYQVTLSERAKSKAGAQLARPVKFSFQVVGYLEVVEVMPGPDATEVDMMSTVTIVFNRPVVPLTSLGQQASLPQPLAFTPSVEGSGEWLNTSIYTFTPGQGFAPATTYKARVQAGLTGLMGSVLKDEYSWTFTTRLPAVTNVYPADKSIYVGPNESILVTFNQPMDHRSAERSFLLTESESGKEVTGKFSWTTAEVTQESLDMDALSSQSESSKLETTVRGETMIFTPDKPLALDASYRASVAKGARAAGGDKGTIADYSWTFSTIALPRVVRSTPADGDTDADYGGGIDIYFSSPISPTTLADNLTIIPEPTNVYSYWYNSETEVYISWNTRPSTAYTVTIGRDLTGRYGHKLGQDVTIRFTTRQADPYLSLINQGRVGTYSVYTDTMAYVSFRNISEINYRLYSLDLADFFKLTGGYDSWQYWDDFAPNPNNLLRKWTKKVNVPLNQFAVIGTRLAQTKQGSLPPGLYFLEVDSPGAGKDRQIMVVSPYNLVLKQSQKSAFLWVTDMKSGAVVPNLPVKVYDSNGMVIATGETNQDGVFQGAYPKLQDMWSTMYVLVGGDDLPNARFGAVLSDWNDGINAWDFNINSEMSSDDYNAYIYTDRPIYRPGQKVYYKGILRYDDWSVYSLPEAGRPITVTVMNGEGEQIYQEVVRLNDMGTFNGSLSLDESASLGYYWLRAQVVGDDIAYGAGFQVAEYRKPQFEISVETDRPEYLQGDKINVHAKAQYYFGGPVANAAVHWSVLTEDASFVYKGKGWYDFTDYDWTMGRYYGGYYGGLVTEGDGMTDDKGEFTFSLPADIADKVNSQRYTIEVSVTGPNDQVVSQNTSAIIHKGLFYVGLAPQRYIGTVGEDAKINVVTVDWESAPSPNRTVTLVYNEHEWYSVETQAEDGSYYWDSKYIDTPVYTETVKTDAEGKAVGSFRPTDGGIYRIIATAKDEKGNEIRSSTFLWVSGEKFINWRQENNDRIDLVADKKSYQVGDQAEILIPSPYQGEVEALITIERGKVISYKRMTLKSNSETIKVPILPEYVPDVFVSVVLVKGPDATMPLASFKLGYVQLNVSTEEKEIKITLKPDKEVYRPGETATYQVETVDAKGKPVEAELSLTLVDKSVLALAEWTQGALMDTFWRERGVGVQTAVSLVRSVDRRNLEVAPEAKGGGGGEAGDMTVRRRFPDTAYWNATVRTDKNGKAEVKVQLPDNLTTWNMSAKAVSADTLVGEAQVDIRSTLPLHVQSILPRFFVVGDEASVGAVIFNETDQPFEVEASLRAQGVEISSDSQKMEVPAHGNIKLRWDVTVQDVESARFTISARGGGLSDAEEYTLPVYRYTAPEAVATAGEVDKGETRTEWIQLPARGAPKQGELKLELSPSLAAGMRQGLTYLETYPYYCIEQTVSRFVPNVMTYKAMKDLGIEDAELEAKLTHFVTVGLQRIYSQQHIDGGWGWWLADDSNPFITAYVLLGLVQVERAGFVVEPEVVNQAVGYLESQLEGSAADVRAPTRDNTLAFVLYALAEAGAGDLGRTVALFDHRDRLSYYGKAFLAMALKLVEPEVDSRVNTLLSDLNNGAIRSATGAHWEERTKDYWNMTTDTRSTAIVLDALVKVRPNSPLIPNVVRWLMAVRQDGRWESTQETAWAIMALTDYMVASGELKADYSYKVLLNGQDWTEGTVDSTNVAEPKVVIKAMADLLRDELNQVSISRLPTTAAQTGEGKLYYSMHLKYYLPVPEVKALNRGIMVARQYELEDEPGKWIDSAKVGDVVRVKLTIVAPNDLHHVVVEDPLPAGCEALDQSLKTTSIVGQKPELTHVDDTRDYWGWWWFSHTEIRDEKVVLFATYLPKGTYQYSYLMRAGLPGEFRVIPSTAYEMYFPEVFGRGDGGLFTISAEE